MLRDLYVQGITETMINTNAMGFNQCEIRSKFIDSLRRLTHLKRLSIQVHNYIGFREAHGRNARDYEELLDEETCQWYKELALDIMEKCPTIDDVVVRATWPDYFQVQRLADTAFDVQQKWFETVDRYKFPLGLVC